MGRVFDVVVSLFMLVLLSPVMLLTTLIIWLIPGRLVFFRQERPGRYGQPFIMIKFRTMRESRERVSRERVSGLNNSFVVNK